MSPSSVSSDFSAFKSFPLIVTEAFPVAPIAVIPERSTFSRSALFVIVKISILSVEIVKSVIDSLLLTVIVPC